MHVHMVKVRGQRPKKKKKWTETNHQTKTVQIKFPFGGRLGDLVS